MWWLLVPLCLVTTQSTRYTPETLYGSEINHGGFGGPVVKLTQLCDRFGVIAGIRGGWIIDHRLTIGGGIYGMASQNVRPDPVAIGGISGRTYRMEMGYVGMELEYAARPHRLMHLALQTLIGGGGVAHLEDQNGGWDEEDDVLQSDGFFIVEPGAHLEINVAGPFRVAVGAGYRVVTDVDLHGMTNDDLSGVSTTLMLKFGGF